MKEGIKDNYEKSKKVISLLYDIKNDPYELNNLVRDERYKNVRVKLAESLRRHMVDAGEESPEIIPSKEYVL